VSTLRNDYPAGRFAKDLLLRKRSSAIPKMRVKPFKRKPGMTRSTYPLVCTYVRANCRGPAWSRPYRRDGRRFFSFGKRRTPPRRPPHGVTRDDYGPFIRPYTDPKKADILHATRRDHRPGNGVGGPDEDCVKRPVEASEAQNRHLRRTSVPHPLSARPGHAADSLPAQDRPGLTFLAPSSPRPCGAFLCPMAVKQAVALRKAKN